MVRRPSDNVCSGITSFLIVRMWFGKAVNDFNAGIQSQGSQAPQLVADTGNAFTSVYIHDGYMQMNILTGLRSGLGCIRLLRRPRHYLALQAQRKGVKVIHPVQSFILHHKRRIHCNIYHNIPMP